MSITAATPSQRMQDPALYSEISSLRFAHGAARETARATELAVSSWQGKDDEINISQAAKSIFSRYSNNGTATAGEAKHAEMSAVTRHGAAVTLESYAAESGAKCSMGRFTQRPDTEKAFSFALSGDANLSVLDLLHTLTVTGANGETKRYEITANTLLTEDDAGNISLRKQAEGPLTGTDGQDILINITDNGVIDGGEGDDRIAVGTVTGSTVLGGDGNDEIRVGELLTDLAGNAVVIDGGSGNDRIQIATAAYARLDSGLNKPVEADESPVGARRDPAKAYSGNGFTLIV